MSDPNQTPKQARPMDYVIEEWRLRVVTQGGSEGEHYAVRKIELLNERITELEAQLAAREREAARWEINYNQADAACQKLNAQLAACQKQAEAMRKALEEYAEPTNWTSEAVYTYEVPFSENSDGNPQEREGRVELDIPIVWQGYSENPSSIALAALAPHTEEK